MTRRGTRTRFCRYGVEIKIVLFCRFKKVKNNFKNFRFEVRSDRCRPVRRRTVVETARLHCSGKKNERCSIFFSVFSPPLWKYPFCRHVQQHKLLGFFLRILISKLFEF